MDWYTIVSIVVIPLIVIGLRKIKMPVKWAPVAAFGIAVGLVAIGKAIGIELDVNTIADAIIRGLATAGIAVLGYDTVKTTIAGK